ncbi:hypothetical protein [Micromonospora sp. NPDC051296]|uniref:hypothetical protein n=1 Tax=Micromonospora sp. NPDC051296 TaxID=3155046 RepID=UPI003427C8E9
MPRYFYVYVGRESRRNLEIGRALGVWGWRSEALDVRSKPDPRPSRDVARSMAVGDFLILAFAGSPGPRRPQNEFVEGSLSELIITRITRPLYGSSRRVWPDDVYPERVDLRLVESVGPVKGQRLGVGAMRALQRSGTTRGIPVAEAPIALGSLILTEDGLPDEPLDLEGDLDILTEVMRRREQRRLRRRQFGLRDQITCDLCGRLVPARLVAAAHIKRRAEASREERLDPGNIMASCLLGCDALFEHGYIYVDSKGVIRAADRTQGDVAASTRSLTGRRCTAYNAQSRRFFEYHATRSGHPWTDAGRRTDYAWLTAGWPLVGEAEVENVVRDV